MSAIASASTSPTDQTADPEVATTAAAGDVNASALDSIPVSFIVTGFGPFAGVPDNPTSSLIRRLRADGAGAEPLADADDGGETSGHVRVDAGARAIRETHIIETSAEDVRRRLDEIYASSNAAVGSGSAAPVVAVALHLGVNYRGTKFQLEKCAYNDATFRVPDERGYQPRRECIIESEADCGRVTNASSSHEWGKCFETELDVHKLCEELKKTEERVTVSRDPGRFVCNYVYCLSLDKCRSANVANTTVDDINGAEGAREGEKKAKKAGHYSLFLHVPPFNVIAEDEQYAFLLMVLEAIGRQLSSGDE